MWPPACALALLLLACALPASGKPAAFAWGVNGHPNVQEGYCQVPVERQIALVAGLGAGWYRCDWDQARLERDPAPYERLVAVAAKRGIHILPVIFPTQSARQDLPPEQIQAASFAFAKALATRFRGRVTHWELDNELDLFSMVHKGETCRDGTLWEWGDPNGDEPRHYEEARYRRAAAELRGLHEGIKAADPRALTIVDAGGWLHCGFFARLVGEDRVPFDLLGWHWYSEMGDITRAAGRDVLAILRGFRKPIWVTEINRRGGSLGGREQEQADWLAAAARQFRRASGVEAFFAYELLDEPYFGAQNPESHYGLVRVSRDAKGIWQAGAPKPAYESLRPAIAGGTPKSH